MASPTRESEMDADHNVSTCLSEWFLLLAGNGLPVPDTTIIHADMRELVRCIDGERTVEFDRLVGAIRTTIERKARYGYPCFLRTGLFSGKHHWLDTCLIDSSKNIGQHVYNLIEESECVDIMGLPYDRWVVRRLLKTEPAFTAWRGLPITREARVFFNDDGVVCYHPYWPPGALDTYSKPSIDNWQERLTELNTFSFAPVLALTERARKAFTGYWSIDFLWAEDQWWVIDMAHGQRSWHWPTCDKKQHGDAEGE